MGVFVAAGGVKTPGSGRTKGIKNKLSHRFLQAPAADFEEHGDGVIRICRVERPHEYLKLIAGLMPREFEVTNTHITEIPDANLDELIYVFEERIRGFIAGADSGEERDREADRVVDVMPLAVSVGASLAAPASASRRWSMGVEPE